MFGTGNWSSLFGVCGNTPERNVEAEARDGDTQALWLGTPRDPRTTMYLVFAFPLGVH